jgi:peptidyl-prolyl cis-trans isomerase D
MPKAEAFLDVAFHTDQGTESQLTEADGDGFFVVRVDQVTAPAPKALAQIRSDVLAAWQAEKRHELAGQRAENIAEHIKKGDTAAQAAQAFGLKAARTEPFTREGAETAKLPPSVVAEMFQAAPGGVATGGTPGGWVVARLDKVVPFEPASNAEATDAARRRISSNVAGDLVDQYIAALNVELGVKVDRSQLAREE